MKYECVKARTLLSKPHVADSWFHMNRSLNAYRGCEHGCVYCDGNSEYYHVDNFYSHVRVKENAVGMHLGMPRKATRPYWELAAKIERGVGELVTLHTERELGQHLLVDHSMEQTIEDILKTGNCEVLKNLEARIDRMAETEVDAEIKVSPDEYV